MAVPNMIVTLAMNATKYSQGLKNAGRQTQSFGQFATKAFSLAKTAVFAMTVAVLRFIPTLANMGAESRKADVQLRFMLENMQGVSKATDAAVKRMGVYAMQVSKATGIDDEQVKAVQKKLLMFKTLRKTVDDMGGTFDRTTMAAIDLAAGGFGSMEQNAIKLGRMLENPVKNLDAMNRAGVTFTETEKAKITALSESGDLLGAQELILEKIEGRVKGLAEESATPFEKMTQQFNEMGDTIGEAMLPHLEEMNTKISEWLASPQGQEDLRNIVDAFVAMAEAINSVVGFVIDLMNAWKDATDQLDAYAASNAAITGAGGIAPSRFYVPGVSGTSGSTSSTTINVTGATDSVAAGREIRRALDSYNKSRGMS
jgi:hypothetical protein